MGYPFRGTENPCVTFINPSLITGDKSLTNVVAHEIFHSWTGNGVTNKDWKNFWVNEGFTTFLERKTAELIYGEDQMKIQAQMGMGALHYQVEAFGTDHHYTKLSIDFAEVNFI